MINRIVIRLLLISVVFLASSSVKADTISFWHIMLNHETVAELNGHNEGYVLQLPLDQLYQDDLLGIRYSAGCMVCANCKTHFAVYDQAKKLVQYEDGRGDWTPIYISFMGILESYYSTGQTIFDCYYQVGGQPDIKRAVYVVRIELI